MEVPQRIFQRLITAAIGQMRQIDRSYDMSKLYYSTTVQYDEEREINIRWVKIPTFRKNNNITFYAICLTDIQFSRMGELKNIHRQCTEAIDRVNIDSYTIFLFGRFHGYIDRVTNKPFRWWKIYILNRSTPTVEDENRVYSFISRVITNRCDRMVAGGMIFGTIVEDVERLRCFADSLNVISTPVCSYTIVKGRSRC